MSAAFILLLPLLGSAALVAALVAAVQAESGEEGGAQTLGHLV